MLASDDPDSAARAFVQKAYNGQNPISLTPLGEGGFIAEMPDGAYITFRPAGQASWRTPAFTANVDINDARAVSQRIESGIPESGRFMVLEARRARRRRGMALSDDLRKRVVDAVVDGGMSRNAAAKRFGVSIASAVRWVCRFNATGEISPAPTGGDQRSHRIEAHGDYLLGLIRRQPDITLLEIQGRLNANCGEHFSSSVIWRFFDRHEITFKKRPRTPRSSNARTS
jgi:transposase